tara:strand:+ start:8334 stop:8594 length:261 start_codon:yes stop_codon:yes gene_type:complete
MDVNQLIENLKKKIEINFNCEEIKILDKTFLHKKHVSHQKGKFHLKIIIRSGELRNLKKLESSRKVHKILENEIKKYIHSIQLDII